MHRVLETTLNMGIYHTRINLYSLTKDAHAYEYDASQTQEVRKSHVEKWHEHKACDCIPHAPLDLEKLGIRKSTGFLPKEIKRMLLVQGLQTCKPFMKVATNTKGKALLLHHPQQNTFIPYKNHMIKLLKGIMML
jgi:hypothetical protein